MTTYVLPASRAGQASVVTTATTGGTFQVAGVGAVGEKSAGVVYSLSAAQGTYALSGQSQPFIGLDRTFAAAQGSYALVGKAAAIGKINKAGAYALAGEPVAFNLGRSLAAASGAYALSGSPQHFGRSRPAASGSYALAGKAITNPQHLSLMAGSGTYLRIGFSGTVLLKVPGGPDSTMTPHHSHMFFADVGAMTTTEGDIDDGGTVTPTSVWSVADAAANGMTLSNGGLTVTGSGRASIYETIRGSISQTTGKVYVEFKTSAAVSGGGIVVFGLGSAGMTVLNDYLGDSNYSYGQNPVADVFFHSAGFTQTGDPGANTIAANAVLGIAVDFAAQKIWVSLNNTWVGNPGAGTGPFATFVAATVGALFPGLSFGNANAGVWTLQATAASQTYAPPAGFTPWG